MKISKDSTITIYTLGGLLGIDSVKAAKDSRLGISIKLGDLPEADQQKAIELLNELQSWSEMARSWVSWVGLGKGGIGDYNYVIQVDETTVCKEKPFSYIPAAAEELNSLINRSRNQRLEQNARGR